MVRDRHSAVLAERFCGDPHAGGHLAPLVLGAVDEADDLVHERRIESATDEVLRGTVLFDVGGEDRIELVVWRQGLVVALVWA